MKHTLYILILATAVVLASCGGGAENSQTVKVFFTTEKDNANLVDCGKTQSVERKVEKFENINILAKETLKQLFAGPREEEKNEGLRPHWITGDSSSNLKSITVEGKTAYVDWKDIRTVVPNASTSCGSASFLAPIDRTLEQFPQITTVMHQIEGNEVTFYEWMQQDIPIEDAANS